MQTHFLACAMDLISSNFFFNHKEVKHRNCCDKDYSEFTEVCYKGKASHKTRATGTFQQISRATPALAAPAPPPVHVPIPISTHVPHLRAAASPTSR